MKKHTEGQLLNDLRDKLQPRAGQTQTATAAKLGFSVAYLQAVLCGSRPITEAVAASLGYRRVVEYVKL